MSQSDALQSSVKDQKSVLPFTVMYNPSLPNIGGSIKKYWDLLNLSKDKNVKFVHDNYTPIVAYNRPRNLQDYLVSSKFSTNSGVGSTDSCKRSRCSHCARINTGQSFTSNITGETFKLRHNTNCQTKNVIYLITCKKCNIQYIGQTKQPVSKRMNSHKFDVCSNYINPAFSTNVAVHFNSTNHSMNDFSFMPIDVVNNGIDRLCKETFWIHKLKSLIPEGLNSKILFNVK